jgi:3-hydroxyacyl-CoA dehydrogenase
VTMIASRGRLALSGLFRHASALRTSTGTDFSCCSNLSQKRPTSAIDGKRQPFSSSPTGFDTLGVVGLGLMGHGICQVAAASDIHSKVVAFEPEQKFLDSGKERIEKSVAKLVSKNKISQEAADKLLGSITFTTDISQLQNVDLVVEAVIENLDLKEKVYNELGSTCKPDTVFASNTSSLSIAEMAAFSGRTDKFVGLHFFNPVQVCS